MTCLTPCPPSSGRRCRCFRPTSQSASSITSIPEPPQIGSLTGSDEPAPPFLPRPSSDTEQAAESLREVWRKVNSLPNSRARNLALTKIEEAGLWLGTIVD